MTRLPYNKKLIIIAIIQFCVFSTFGQQNNSLDITAVLQQSMATWQANTNGQDYQKLESTSTPWVENISFRTETYRAHLPYQRYAARFSFRPFAVDKAFKKYFDLKKTTGVQFDLLNMETKRLANVYQNILSLYFYQKHFRLLKEELNYVQIRKKVLKLMVEQGDKKEAENLLETEIDLYKIEDAQEELRLKAKQQFAAIQVNQMDLETLEFKDLISLSDIKSRLQIHDDVASTNLDIQKYQGENTVLEAEIELEKTKGNSILDYAQIGYGNRNNWLLKEEFNIGIGVSIPYTKGKTLKEQEIALKIAQNRQLASLEKTALDQELRQLRTKLNTSFELYENLRSKLNRIQKEKLFALQSDPNYGSPLAVANLAIEQHELQYKLLDFETSIFEDYIDYLLLSGDLMAMPRVNYLSVSQQPY